MTPLPAVFRVVVQISQDEITRKVTGVLAHPVDRLARACMVQFSMRTIRGRRKLGIVAQVFFGLSANR